MVANDQRNRVATLPFPFRFRRIRRSGSRTCYRTSTLQQALAFENPSDFLKAGLDVSFGKADLTESLNIGKLFTSIFQKDDRSREIKASLKQASLMDDVHSSMKFAVGLLVFGRHHQQCNCRVIEHL